MANSVSEGSDVIEISPERTTGTEMCFPVRMLCDKSNAENGSKELSLLDGRWGGTSVLKRLRLVDLPGIALNAFR